jgi:hypothetical protein
VYVVHPHVGAERRRVLTSEALVEIPGMFVVLCVRDSAGRWLASANLVAMREAQLVALAVGYRVLASTNLLAVLAFTDGELNT